MIKKHYIKLMIALVTANLFFHICANFQSQHTQITTEYVKSGNLEEEKRVFTRSFQNAYKDIPLDVLKIESLDAFLEGIFEDESMDLNNFNKNVFCCVAKNEGVVVGVIFFEPTERENEIYIRQLTVDPSMQKQGIGQRLISAIQTTFPSTKKLVLATRKINVPACNFYKKNGFKPCKEVPHGLNPERYVGFEKDII